MYMRGLTTIAPLVGLAILMAACDGYAAFTVVNESNLTLTARLLEESCDESSLNESDVLGEDGVPAHGTLEYSDVLAGASRAGRCVQVYTEDGDLVLAEKYEESASYVVSANPKVLGHVEATDVLPAQGWLHRQKEWLSDYPVPFLFVWGLRVWVIGGVAFGMFLAIRALRSRERARRS